MLPAGLRFVTVRQGDRLVALLPCAPTRDVSALGGRVMRPFLSPFVTATAPLIADGPERAAHAQDLVAALEAASGGGAWRWPLLPTQEGAVPDMLAAMRTRGWAVGIVAAFERPVMDRRADHDAFLAGHPNRSRFKDLRRRTRRLAETGTVGFQSATSGADLARLVSSFLTLERAGW